MTASDISLFLLLRVSQSSLLFSSGQQEVRHQLPERAGQIIYKDWVRNNPFLLSRSAKKKEAKSSGYNAIYLFFFPFVLVINQDGIVSRVWCPNVARIPDPFAANAVARQPDPFASIAGAQHVCRFQHSTER